MSRVTLTNKEKKRKKEKIGQILVISAITIALGVAAIRYISFEPTQEENRNWANSQNIKSGEKEEVNITNTKYQDVEKNPVVTMEMLSGEIVKIELYPKIAPTTVENFIELVESGFYDGLTFHRLIPDFMAQGGDPSGDGTGGPGYSIFGEFSDNGFENNLSHEIGVISMARSNEPDSAGSQFFIVTNEESYLSLDGKYAGFGKVIEGMDVVYDIVNTKTKRTDYSDELMQEITAAGGQITTEKLYYKYMNETTEMTTPIEAPTIKKMTVDTFGYKYGEPEKLK